MPTGFDSTALLCIVLCFCASIALPVPADLDSYSPGRISTKSRTNKRNKRSCVEFWCLWQALTFYIFLVIHPMAQLSYLSMLAFEWSWNRHLVHVTTQQSAFSRMSSIQTNMRSAPSVDFLSVHYECAVE